MRLLSLNASTPTIKQGEFNSSAVEILVPLDMRGYNLFLVFELPSGEKVFTPSILLDVNNMISYALPAAVLSEIGRVQVELQGFIETSYIKSVTYSFTVVKSLTGPTTGSGSELKQVDYLPWYTEAAGFKSGVELIANAYKLDEALRVSKEIARVAGESARIIAENNRVESEDIREDNEAIRIANENQRIANLALFAEWVDPLTGIEARVDAIITTPVGSVSAQEIVDARQGAITLGANLSGVKSELENRTNKRFYFLDAYNKFFGGKANDFLISPLWVNSSHLTPAGYDAWASFIVNAKDSEGIDILRGTNPKVTLLGDSWIANDTALYDAVLAKFPGATVVNAGISGNTSDAMIARFDASVSVNSDYVIFNEPGVNDIYQQYAPTVYVKNLEILVKKIRGIGATPVFVGIPPLSDFSDATFAQNNLMIAQIGDGKMYPSVPVSASTQAIYPEPNSFGVGDNNFRQRTTGIRNTAVGVNALRDIKSGISNMGFGSSAGAKITDGHQNVAIGDQALANDLIGGDNTAIGQGALYLATQSYNVAIGSNAGFSVTTGIHNVMIGKGAGYQAGISGDTDATTTGNNNTNIGSQSGSAIDKSDTVAIGYRAKASNWNATALGSRTIASHPGAVVIGRDSADASAVSTATDDFILGTVKHKVKVLGTLNVARKTPTGSADVIGIVGDITSDDNYVYVKTSTGWKRSALTAW